MYKILNPKSTPMADPIRLGVEERNGFNGLANIAAVLRRW